jgi:urea transport system permease protein
MLDEAPHPLRGLFFKRFFDRSPDVFSNRPPVPHLLTRSLLRLLLAFAVWAVGLSVAIAQTPTAATLPADVVVKLTTDELDARVEAVEALTKLASPLAMEVLQALLDEKIKWLAADKAKDKTARAWLVRDNETIDLATGAKLAGELSADAEDITVNNRLRRAVEGAQSALALLSPDVAVRRKAAATVLENPSPEALPLVERALAKETDEGIRHLLQMAQALTRLGSDQVQDRLAAVQMLATSADPQVKAKLLELTGDSEPDASVRAAAVAAVAAIERRIAASNAAAAVFTGVSLGSVLLLAALGLAITYGLMGVINMAHGELVMIGAYATFVVQNLFRQYAPGAFDWYPLAAIPVAFLVSALVGVAMERTVIRYLYGRPLETLLATWGLSLVLIQAVRSLFGAQNVQVENPAWLSGGFALTATLTLPYSRIAIIGFAVAVLVATWLLLTRTRLGLFVRAVTQNRSMADCVGVPTARVDMLAFGFGSGVAGLGGVALSQIGNVGPDLGQSYIVDSFMVVVLGGVGQLAGTVYAAMGLGMVNKLLEGEIGAVLAKIAILVAIILFIQKRPQGLFALKGRFADQ